MGKLKNKLEELQSKGSVKTNYLDRKIDRWNDDTKKFKDYIERKGFVSGTDFKIENIRRPSNQKQRFIWLR